MGTVDKKGGFLDLRNSHPASGPCYKWIYIRIIMRDVAAVQCGFSSNFVFNFYLLVKGVLGIL